MRKALPDLIRQGFRLQRERVRIRPRDAASDPYFELLVVSGDEASGSY